MSTKNIWNLFNLNIKKNSDSSTNLNKLKKRRIINSKQKLTSIQYKTESVSNRQKLFSNYLSPLKNSQVPLKINQKTILKSIEYSNQYIADLQPVLWIDSSDLTSILRDGNNDVYQILDKSGNNNHLYQTVKANQPKYHNGGLLFNNNQYLTGTNTFTQSINTMSIFIIMKQYNQTNQFGGIMSGYSLNSNNDYDNANAWAFHSSDSSTYQYKFISNGDNNPNNYMINSNNINSTMPYGVYEIIINNGTGYLYYNGTLINSASFVSLGNFTNLVLGARYNGSSPIDKFYTGEIYEVMILNSALNAGDRYKVERYLLDKWSTSQISRTIPISNIYTWLDASSINNFTLDANNNVLEWKDKNNILNFTQSNSSFYPVFDTNKIIFNGSYLSMIDSSGLDLNNFSIFYVFEELTHTNYAALLSCVNTPDEYAYGINDGFELTTSIINTISLDLNSQVLSYTDPTALSKKLYEFNINNGIGTLYVNGVLQSTTTFGTLGTSHQFVIGARQTPNGLDTSFTLHANIYELIILNTSASYSERSQMYSYLSEKWNIPCILSLPAPNQKVWLDSNNSSSLTVDSGNIIGWNDISGNNYPVTINNTPPFQTIVNGLNYATFNGSDLNIDFDNNGGILNGINFTLYIVFSENTITLANSRLISFNNGSGDTFNNTLNINSANNQGYIQTYNQNFICNETLNIDNNLNILSISSTNVWSIFINNYLIKTSDTGNNYNFSSLDIGNILGGTLPWNGYINEVIFYDTNLDSYSNLGIINYLSNKWSIPISSSPINEYIPRTLNTALYSIPLNHIFQNETNTISVSDTIDKSGPLNFNIQIPISNTKPNQLSILTIDPLYLSVIDKNITYNLSPFVNYTTIVLPSLNYNGDYFAFINNSTYNITITGPNINYILNAGTTTPRYFTYSFGSYTSSNNFNGFVCTLNKYDNIYSDNFSVYLGGWSNTLSYIKQLYIYDNNNNYIASTGNIYFNNTYQADFNVNLLTGTYTFVVSDIKSNTGNIINSTINTPIEISIPTATLDHYNNGSTTYTITFSNWSTIYLPIPTLDVWVSTDSNYSNSIYLVTTDTIVDNNDIYSTSFTNAFDNGFYWLTLINTSTAVSLTIKIAQPVVTINNLSASLDNITHTNPYNLLLTNWLDVYTTNIPNLYIHGYLNSDFSDDPIQITYVSTSEIVNIGGVYQFPFIQTFDIGRNYYLSISDTFDLTGIFNIHLTNHISELVITGSIDPLFGYCNISNVYTITLTNDETYDLTQYLTTWFIYRANNSDGLEPVLVTSTTLNSNQTLVFSFNPQNISETQYFYVANSGNYTGSPYWSPTSIYGCQLWLDLDDTSTINLSNGNVQTINDKSGYNNTTHNYYGQSVTATTLNGLNALQFTNTFLAGNINNIITTNSITVFAVATMNSLSTGGGRLISLAQNGANDFNNPPFLVGLSRNYAQNISTQRNGYISSMNIPAYNVPFIAMSQQIPFQSSININASENPVNNSTPYDSTYAINWYSLGTNPNTSDGNGFFYGKIAEVLVYNFKLSPLQQQVVEGYLAWKWNLNSLLPLNHTFYTHPPLTNQPSIWSPTNISGCQLWLDASKLNNFTFSSSYNINTWLDRSGNNNVATCTGTSSYTGNSVSFNNSTYFTTPYTSSAATETCFIVMTFNNTYSPFIIDTNTANDREYGLSSGISQLNSQGDITYASGVNTLNAGVIYLLTYSYNSTTINLYYNGVLDSTTSGSFSFTGNGTTVIGTNPSFDRYLNGTINEILIYNSVLTTTQQQIVEGYLGWKWNINSNLPSNHPFFNAPPAPDQPLSLNKMKLLLVSPKTGPTIPLTVPLTMSVSMKTNIIKPKTTTVKDRILSNIKKKSLDKLPDINTVKC